MTGVSSAITVAIDAAVDLTAIEVNAEERSLTVFSRTFIRNVAVKIKVVAGHGKFQSLAACLNHRSSVAQECIGGLRRSFSRARLKVGPTLFSGIPVRELIS